MADPQVCRTEINPMRAPRRLGSAAILRVVSAEALNRTFFLGRFCLPLSGLAMPAIRPVATRV
jgi:hypothetical protein